MGCQGTDESGCSANSGWRRLPEEGQDALARHELGRAWTSYREHTVREADVLVPGLQTLEGVVDDDIVHVVASVMEGPNVVTELVSEASDVLCLQVHPTP